MFRLPFEQEYKSNNLKKGVNYMGTVLKATQSFHAPPANIDLIVGKRKVYYRSNMEFVTGILGT